MTDTGKVSARIQPVKLMVEHKQPMASSIQIARHFGKRHKGVLLVIRKAMDEVSKNFYEHNFIPIEKDVLLPHSGGIRKDPAYMLTKDGFAYVCMGFTGKNAARWKEQYIEAFNRMEAELRSTSLESYPWPPLESGRVRQNRMIKILWAMLAHWANLDNIPLETAHMALCLHLGVQRLEDCLPDYFGKSLDYLSRARCQPFNAGGRATAEQLESIRLIAEGCSQFRAFRDGDLYGYLSRVYGLSPNDFENLSYRSAHKIIAALSGLFFQFWGQSEYLSHFEALYKE
jgi:Rha family phage regulatory protein